MATHILYAFLTESSGIIYNKIIRQVFSCIFFLVDNKVDKKYCVTLVLPYSIVDKKLTKKYV